MNVNVGSDGGLEIGAFTGTVGGIGVGDAIAMGAPNPAGIIATVFVMPDIDLE